MCPLSFTSLALHPCIRRHHRNPADPGRAPLYTGQQRRQKPANLHHIFCVWIIYDNADNYWHQVTHPNSLTGQHNTAVPATQRACGQKCCQSSRV